MLLLQAMMLCLALYDARHVNEVMYVKFITNLLPLFTQRERGEKITPSYLS
jgi:hypothetical protein